MKENRQTAIVHLPKDIPENIISPLLSLKELNRLARTSKGLNSLFKKAFTDRKVDCLLQHVAFGEQEQAEKILKSNRDLLFHKGTLTDYSLRTFKGITAFQYALWALDRHMWQMILNYLPREEAAKQLHEHIYDQKAYKAMQGDYYDFVPLIKALQVYVDNYGRWSAAEDSKHWCEEVGGAQRLVPVHVANEYCRADRSFYLMPEFNEGNLPRGITFYNYTIGATSSWFPLTSNGGLGCDFAVGGMARRGCGQFGQSEVGASRDLSALIALCKVRTSDLVKLKLQLLNPAPAPEESSAGPEKSSCVIC